MRDSTIKRLLLAIITHLFKFCFCLLIFNSNSASVQAQDWTLIDTNITHTSYPLRDIFFTNDSTAFVVGGGGWGTGAILKTSDYGQSWVLTTTTHNMNAVYFPSNDTGYAAGEQNTILKTINGGNTWTYQNVLGVSPAFSPTSICFLNNYIGFVGLHNGPGYAFLKTTDGGASWVNDISDTVHMDYFSKVNDSTIYGMYGRFSVTNNYGQSWDNFTIPNGACRGLYFLNDSVGFATLDHDDGGTCQSYSTLIKTTNRGLNWTQVNFGCNFLYSINFPSDQIGYMLGTVTVGGPRVIWKTYDGGENWHEGTYTVGPGYDSTYSYGLKIKCTDANTCYLITNYGTILKTTNGAGPVGIHETIKPETTTVSIFPNPTNGQVSLKFISTEDKIGLIEIKNLLGQTILTKKISFVRGDNEIQIDISDVTGGLYFIQVFNGKESQIHKLIKK